MTPESIQELPIELILEIFDKLKWDSLNIFLINKKFLIIYRCHQRSIIKYIINNYILRIPCDQNVLDLNYRTIRMIIESNKFVALYDQILLYARPEIRDKSIKCLKFVNLLRYYIRFNHLEIIKLLVKSIDFTSLERIYCHGILHFVINRGNLEMIQLFIDILRSPGKGIELYFHSGNLLNSASRKGDVDIVKLLLENGADSLVKNNSALYWAVRFNRISIVKLLLEKGNGNIIENKAQALQWAIQFKRTKIIKFLS